jgi:hypothetical protein
MTDVKDNFERIKGVVSDVYEDFNTLVDIVKGRAVAFGLDVAYDNGNDNVGSDGNGENYGNKKKVIIVYDKNAVELGLVKVGETLTCFGKYDGMIAVVDSSRNVVEDKMFVCIGVMGNADIDEETLVKQGAIKWSLR